MSEQPIDESVVSGCAHLASLATKAGYENWESVLEDNTELMKQRFNPLVLFHGDESGAPGDTVKILPIVEKQSSGETGQHVPHQVRSSVLRLRLLVLDENDRPLLGALYRLEVDGIVMMKMFRNGGVYEPEDGCEWWEADSDGSVDFVIPKTAQRGRLDVAVAPPNRKQDQEVAEAAVVPGKPDQPDVRPEPIHISYDLQIGRLDPIAEEAPDRWCLSGVQQRLNNLGFEAGHVDGVYGPHTAAALKRFQGRLSIVESAGDVDAFRQYWVETRPMVRRGAIVGQHVAPAPANVGAEAADESSSISPTAERLYVPGTKTQTALAQCHDEGTKLPPRE